MVNIESLLDDILVKIFSYLSLVELIDNVRLTSTRWRSLTYDFYLWKTVDVGYGSNNNAAGLLRIRNAIVEKSNSIEEFTFRHQDLGIFDVLRKHKSLFTKLTRLRLLNCFVKETDVDFLTAYPSLEHITLESDNVDPCARLINNIMQFEGLRHLELQLYSHASEWMIVNNSILGSFPNLNTLIIRGGYILGSVVNKVYKGSPLLKKLHLYCDVTCKEAFADMPGHCSGLEDLSLQITTLLTEDDWMNIVRNTPNLLSLSMNIDSSLDINTLNFMALPVNFKTDRSISFIANSCKKLENLKINFPRLHLTNAGMDDLVHSFKNLRKFHFHFQYDCKYVKFSSVPEHFRKLEVFSLSPCSLTDESIILLSQLADNLSDLWLSECDCITGIAISQIVVNCRRLNNLIVTNCKNRLHLNFDELHQKSTPFGRTPITGCNSNCYRRDDSSVALVQPMGDRYHHCPVNHDIHLERRPVVSHVKEISMSGTAISKSSMFQIAKHCPDLETLRVSEGDIYDDAVEALVKNCVRLRSLALHGTKLTDDGLRAIATFGSNLRFICITQSKLGEIRSIEDIMSKCKLK